MPKVEIRNVHFSERFSEETNLFDAVVYIDGKKVGTVENEGQGGSNSYEPWELEKTLTEIAKTLPKHQWEGGEYEQDADILIGDLFDAWLKSKEEAKLKKKIASGTAFTLKGDPKGTYRFFKGMAFTPQVKANLIRKYGDKIDKFLNEETSAILAFFA